jgi:hypothetical protein
LDEQRPFAARNIDADRYRSYMLRLWREAPGEPWRCQIRCVGTGREWRFAGLAETFEFLLADTASGDQDEDGCSETPDATPEGRSTDSPAPEMTHQ